MPNSGSRWRIVVLSYGRAGKYYRTGFWFCFFKALYWLLSQYKHLACENWPEWPLRASARLSFYESWSQTKWIRWDHQCQGPLGTVGTYFTGKLTILFQRATAFSSWQLSCLKEILCHQFLRISVTYLNIQWIGPRNYIFLKKKSFFFLSEGLRNQYCQHQEVEHVSIYMITPVKSNIEYVQCTSSCARSQGPCSEERPTSAHLDLQGKRKSWYFFLKHRRSSFPSGPCRILCTVGVYTGSHLISPTGL